MAISADVFRAILALDAYNRGYGAGIALSGNQIGNAIITRDSSTPFTDGTDQAAGFYAVAYNVGSVTGFSAGGTLVSYRGTNADSLGALVTDALNGYGVGGGSPHGEQARLAIEFYKTVAGSAPRTANVELTGHSLGGGLAGLVAAIYGKRAVIFDNMPFEAAASRGYNESRIIWDAVGAGDPASIASQENIYRKRVYGTTEPWAVNSAGVTGFAVNGELLVPLRALQSTPVTMLPTYGGARSPIDLHSQALLTTLMFARSEKLSGSISDDWNAIGSSFIDALFSESIASKIGVSGTINGAGSASAKMLSAIAYSAIDEGQRIFGDTGIRALFNDANDLGKALKTQNVSSTLSNSAAALTQMLVQFAGQIAVGKVLQSSASAALQGVLAASSDGKTLSVDFATDLWSLGRGSAGAATDIIGRKNLTDIVLRSADFSTTGTPPNDIRSGMKWLWNDEDSKIIDRIGFAATNDALNTTLPNRAIPSSKVFLFAAGGGNDTITGSRDDDMIYGGDGDDNLKGVVGNDLLAGGAGNDTLTGGPGKNFLAGGSGDDTAILAGANSSEGLRLTMTKVAGATGREKIFEFKRDAANIDRVTDIEKVELTDNIDYVVFDRDSLSAGLTVDMRGSNWSQDFINNRDVADFSNIESGITYNNGSVGVGLWAYSNIVGYGSGLKVKGVEKVILTAKNDWIVNAAPGTIIETGDGSDTIWYMGKNVAISDLSYQDRIKLAGILPLFGGLRNINSNSIYATSWGGLFKYAVNSEGELQISSDVFEDMWILNYGDTSPTGEKAGHIYLYQYELEVRRLMEKWPSHLSIMGTWELFGAIVKTHFGISVWKGMDPLVLDLDGDGVELSTRSSVSPRFDIDGDGYAERSGWVKGDDGILVRDLNGNGTIDDVTEMFGNSSTGGFAALAALDRNGDGKVDAQDDIEDTNGNGVIDGNEQAIAAGQRFSDLRVWRDINQNGKTDAGELFSLSELGITSIFVSSTASNASINGNQIAGYGTYTKADGSTGVAADVVFSVDNVFTEYVGGPITINPDALDLPELKGQGTLVSLREAMSLSAGARASVEAALPLLSSVKLEDLRTAATPILTAWAQGSPLTDDDGNAATNPAKLKPHSDVHILIATDAVGHERVVDVAFLTSSTKLDETGNTVVVSHWARASGAKVYDETGAIIRYPSISQLLAGDTADGEAWSLLSGNQLAVVERMIGEELPLDKVQPTGTASIPGLSGILDSALGTLNLAVARLVVQAGPLSSFFSGISYDVEANGFTAKTDAELAPVYTAILAAAATSGQGVGWLQSWRPLLDIVIGDFHRQGGAGLLNTYGFIAHNVVSAYETVATGLSFASVAEAFGVPAEVLVTGAGAVIGSRDADILYATGGNFTLSGGHGADEYVVGHQIGHSVIQDVEAPLFSSYDILRLVFLKPEDVVATRVGTKLVLTVAQTGETLEVPRQFEGELPGLFGGDVSEDTGVNEIVFADGTVWTKFDIAEAVSHPDSAATTLVGTADNDYLDGGAGDDVLIGQGDGDFYVYARGYGNDRIEDLEDFILREAVDVLILKGLTPDDVEFLRNGIADDLIIKIRDTGETLSIKDQFVATYTGVFGTQWMSRIEAIKFADGSIMNADDVMHAITAQAKTSGNDTIYGFSIEDRLDGGAGDDFLSGGNENDTYVFGIGYGHDVIQDKMTNILSGDVDTIEFGPGLTVADVIFSRIGESPDLLISLRDHPDTLTVKDFYTVVETGPFGARAFDLIEKFRWADGTEKGWRAIQLDIIAASQTNGDDLVVGTHFDETLNGGEGNDILKGGNGSDTYVFDRNSGDDTIIDFYQNILAGNDDRIVFGQGISPDTIVLERFGSNLEGLRFVLPGGEGTLSIEGQFSYSSINYRMHEIESFEFADGTIWSSAQVRQEYLSRLDRGASDTIEGFWSNDVISGGAGDDVLRGQDGSDTYRFDLGFGQDVIEESVQNVMYDDNDVVEFGAGLLSTNVQFTRSGDDLLIAFGGVADQLTIRGQFSHSAWFGGWRDIETFKFYDNVVWADQDVRNKLIAQSQTAGNDVVTGYYTGDRLDGGAGDDILRGLGGADVYVFGKGYGADVIEESIDNVYEDLPDTVAFDASITPSEVQFSRVGDDLKVTITGYPDTLTIRDHFASSYKAVELFKFADGTILTAAQAAAGALQSAATPGDDIIIGTSSSDLLDGGAGNDLLKGGDGADTYMFSAGFGHDVIEESVVNVMASDNDTVVFGPGLTSTSATLRREGSDLIIEFAGTGDALKVKGQFDHSAYFDGWTDIETFKFGDGVQWTAADIERKLLAQSVSSGADIVTGYWGNDVIDGGAGNDVLRGLGGADTYIFRKGSGHDVIEESIVTVYEDLPDTISFDASVSRSEVQFLKQGYDLLIRVDAENSIRVRDHFTSTGFSRVEKVVFSDGSVLEAADISYLAVAGQASSGDDIITGTYQADKLEGKTGNDVLSGGEGSDAYIYTRGDGDDTVDESSFYAGIADSLRLIGVEPADVTLERAGDNLTLVIAETAAGAGNGGRILLKSQLLSLYNVGIEGIVFDNGTTWTADDLRLKVLAAASTAGNDTITGFNTNDTLSGGLGNDLLAGKLGSDTYVYNRGDGNDVVDESGIYEGTADKLVLNGVASTAVTIEWVGNDVMLMIAESVIGAGDGGRITLRSQYQSSYNQGVETITFSDGISWTQADIANMIANQIVATGITHPGTASDDTIVGSSGNDTFDGRGGNDTLKGGEGSDTYRFGTGSGNDVIIENSGSSDIDRIELLGLNPDDVIFSRSGQDLFIGIRATGETLKVQNHFLSTFYGVEQVAFANGTNWDRSAVQQAAWIRGDANDNTLIGTSSNDTLDGGAGNDTLKGGEGSDTYRFGAGSGNDVVIEGAGSTDTDRIELFGLNPDDVVFSRSGQDLIISVKATGETLTVQDHFISTWYGVEQVAFANGTIWDRSAVQQAAWIRGDANDNTLIGTSSNDTLDGGAGNDTLKGGDGSDIYRFGAGSGNDTIIETSGSANADQIELFGLAPDDVVFSRVGQDLFITIKVTNEALRIQDHFLSTTNGIEHVVFANGASWDRASIKANAWFYGTSGDDTIQGSTENDRIVGFAGNDVITDAGGSDLYLYASGEGSDRIVDTSTTTGETDTLRLTDLNLADLTFTRTATDLLIRVTATGHVVTVTNQFVAPKGIELIEFANGLSWSRADIDTNVTTYANALNGTPGNDTITGTSGADVISGGVGNDILKGQGGSDTYLYNSGDGDDQISEGGDSSSTDKLVFGAGLNASDAILTRSGSSGDDLTIGFAGTSGSVWIDDGAYGSGYGIEQFVFGDGTTWSLADMRAAYLSRSQTSGNDTIYGFTTVADTISGGAGNDILRGLTGSDTYLYNSGDGNDQIVEAGDSASTDKLVFGTGLNANDAILTRSGSNGDDLTIGFAGVSGSILIDDGAYGSGYGVEQFVFGDGTTWNLAGMRTAYLSRAQTSGNDTIYGFATVADTISGGAGNDTLRGLTGADTYLYNLGDGNDQIVEAGDSASTDKLVFGTGLNASDAILTRSGSNGDDLTISFAGISGSVLIDDGAFGSGYGIEQFVFGDGTTWNLAGMRTAYLSRAQTSGNDTIYGFATVADTISGGAGNDTLRGLTGADTYLYNLGDGNDQIVDAGDSASTDKLVLGAGLDKADIVVTRSISDVYDVTISFTGVAGSVFVDDGFFGSGGYGIEQYLFNDGTVWGVSDLLARAWFRGTGSNETITGTSTDDRIDAGGGNDTLSAGGGNDLLIGGAGNDTLTGGAGNDVFVFAAGFGKDTITDFVTGAASADVIEFDDAVFADLSAVLAAASQVGADTLITYDANNTITLKNVTKTALHTDDFRFV